MDRRDEDKDEDRMGLDTVSRMERPCTTSQDHSDPTEHSLGDEDTKV